MIGILFSSFSLTAHTARDMRRRKKGSAGVEVWEGEERRKKCTKGLGRVISSSVPVKEVSSS